MLSALAVKLSPMPFVVIAKLLKPGKLFKEELVEIIGEDKV